MLLVLLLLSQSLPPQAPGRQTQLHNGIVCRQLSGMHTMPVMPQTGMRTLLLAPHVIHTKRHGTMAGTP